MAVEYLPNKVFYVEYDKCVKEGRASDKLVLQFQTLAKNRAKFLINIDKQTKDACISYAVACAWEKWDRFNSEISKNVFAYFTKMMTNDMLLHLEYLTKSRKHNISIDAIFSSENFNH